MPGMSGVEVLDHLRRDRPTLRVVIMTANEDIAGARATLPGEVLGDLRKPFRIDVLAGVVAAAVAPPS